MQVRFGQIMTATEVQRFALTQQVAQLVAAGVPVDTLLADVREGLAGRVEVQDVPVMRRALAVSA